MEAASRSLLLACAIGLLVSACAETPPPRISTPYDEAQALGMLAAGPNTVKGSALIRQQGGGVVTCAGTVVVLLPATEYARQRMYQIYGSDRKGWTSRNLNLAGTPPTYAINTKSTVCDAQGFFSFEKVADGEFFVTTTIRWVVGYDRQGGNLMGRVMLAGGQSANIVLAP